MGTRKRPGSDKGPDKPEQHLRRWLPELEKPATRQQAVQALAELGVPAVGPLARVMRESEHNTSQAAARALTQIGAPAVEALCELLGDEDWNVSQSAALALVRIGEPAVEPLCRVLSHSNPVVPHLAVQSLTKIRKPACDALCRALGSPEPEVRAQARKALIKMRTAAVPTVTRAFHHPEKYAGPAGPGVAAAALTETVRIGAADVLCGIGGSAIDVLCGSLGSADEAMRRIAVGALEQNRPRAVEALGRYLEAHAAQPKPASDGEVPAGVLAAVLLGRMGRLRAQEPLVHALQSPEARVRAAATRALGELAQETRAPELRAHLQRLKLRMVRQLWVDRDSEECKATQFAIEAIERATAGVAAVPVPVPALPPEQDTLPRPASSVAPAADTLPRAAADAGEAAAPKRPQDWWSRFSDRFRAMR